MKLSKILVVMALVLVATNTATMPVANAQPPATFQKVWAFELTDEGGQGISFINRSPFANTVTVKVYNPGGTLNMTQTVSLAGYETKTVYPGHATGSGGWGLPKTVEGTPATDTAYMMVATAPEFFSVMMYPDEIVFGSGKSAIWAQNTVMEAWWGMWNYRGTDGNNAEKRDYFFISNPGSATANVTINLYKSDGTDLGTNSRSLTVGGTRTVKVFPEEDLSSDPNVDGLGWGKEELGPHQDMSVHLSSDQPVNVQVKTTLGTDWDKDNLTWKKNSESAGVYVAYESICLPTKWSWIDNKNGDQQTAARVTNPNTHAITIRQTWYTTDGVPASYVMDTAIPARGTAELPAPTPFDPGYKNETINGKFRLFRTVESVGDQGNPVAGFHVHVTYDVNIDLPAPHQTDWWWGSYAPGATDELFFINTGASNLTINVEYAEGGSALQSGQMGGTPIVLPPNAPPGRALEWQIPSDYLAPDMTAPSVSTAGTDGHDFTLHYYSDTAFPLHLEWTASGAYGDLLPYDCGAGTAEDYGDNPDTGTGTGAGNYQTLNTDNGPHHTVTDKLYLGDTVDVDNDGQPTVDADGDDSNDASDDEDGVDPAELVLAAGSTESVEVTVFNNSGSAAYLVGWIDFDGDGQFETSERVTQTVPSSVSPQLVTLDFGTVPSGGPSTTYARFRVGLDEAKAELPTGWGGVGEIEDYAVTVHPGCQPNDMVGADELVRPEDGYVVTWDITNNSSLPLIIETIRDLQWPEGNGALEEVRLDGKTIWSGNEPETSEPFTISGGWAGTLADRTIEPADAGGGGGLWALASTSGTEPLELEFQYKTHAPSNPQPYFIRVECVGAGCDDEIESAGATAITISSFAAKSSVEGAASPLWLGLAGLTVLAAGSLFWMKRRAS